MMRKCLIGCSRKVSGASLPASMKRMLYLRIQEAKFLKISVTPLSVRAKALSTELQL